MEQYYEKNEWYYFVPIILLVTIMPLIVHLKVINLDTISYLAWNGKKVDFDFFSYYKTIFIYFCTSLGLVMLMIRAYHDNKKIIEKSMYFYLILTYSCFTILSAVFSKYKSIALKGFVNRYEGTYIIICYMLIILIVINIIKKEKEIYYIIDALIIGSVLIGIIGLTQLFGHDIFTTDFGKNLILTQKYKQYANNLKISFGGAVYSTLYNPDYIGSYVAMIFPLMFTILVLSKNKIIRIISAIISVLMLINLYGSNSRAGYVGSFAALIIFLIIINKVIRQNWKKVIIIVPILCIGIFIINYATNDKIAAKFSYIANQATELFKNSNVDKKDYSDTYGLKSINVVNNEADILTTTESLKIKVINGRIHFFNEKNQELLVEFNKTTGQVSIKEPLYKGYNIILGKLENINALRIDKGKIRIYLGITENSINLMDQKGQKINISNVEKYGFEGKETIGSGRGYIWSRTIPMLKHTIFIGYGPDTFTLHFPQNDLIGKLKTYGDMWMLVDKPHNYYLQVATSTGIISLVILIALFISYITESWKLYYNSVFTEKANILGCSIFMSVCGYLVCAFFNDSVVSVAPIFWILLGCGIAINKMIRQMNIKKEQH